MGLKPMLTPETHSLVVGVMESNQGALSLCERLCYRTKWYEIMVYCIEWGITGDILWQLYAQGCQHDTFVLGDYLENRMIKEDQERSVAQRPVVWHKENIH